MKLSKEFSLLNFQKILFLFLGVLIAIPGIEISGISTSYFPCFIGLIFGLKLLRKIPPVILSLFGSGFLSFALEVFDPTSPGFMGQRYRSITNQISTKFASSTESENFVIWMKFSIALMGSVMILMYAYSRAIDRMMILGFIYGAIASVFYGILTLRPGDGAFVQSVGLGRTNTTFGMICSYTIALVISRFGSSKLSLIFIFILVVGSIISGSRGALLTTFISLFFSVIWQRNIKKIFLLSWVTSVSILVLIQHGNWLNSFLGFRAFTSNTSVINSDILRMQLREQSILDWNYDPISGVGFSVLTQGHNNYLQTLAAGGMILFAGYFIMDLKCFTSVISAQKVRNQGYLLALFFCTLINHLTQNQIDIPFLYFIVGIILIESKKNSYANQGFDFRA